MSKQEKRRLERLKKELDNQQKKLDEDKKKFAAQKKQHRESQQKLERQQKQLQQKVRKFQLSQSSGGSSGGGRGKSGKGGGGGKLQVELNKTKGELKDTKDQLGKAKKTVRELRKSIDDKEATIKALKRQLKNAGKGKKPVGDDKIVKQLKREIANLKKRLKLALRDLDKQARYYQQQLKRFKQDQQKWINRQRDVHKKKGVVVKYVFIDDIRKIKVYKKGKNRIKVRTRDGGEVIVKDVQIVEASEVEEAADDIIDEVTKEIEAEFKKKKKKKKKKRKGLGGDDDDGSEYEDDEEEEDEPQNLDDVKEDADDDDKFQDHTDEIYAELMEELSHRTKDLHRVNEIYCNDEEDEAQDGQFKELWQSVVGRHDKWTTKLTEELQYDLADELPELNKNWQDEIYKVKDSVVVIRRRARKKGKKEGIEEAKASGAYASGSGNVDNDESKEQQKNEVEYLVAAKDQMLTELNGRISDLTQLNSIYFHPEDAASILSKEQQVHELINNVESRHENIINELSELPPSENAIDELLPENNDQWKSLIYETGRDLEQNDAEPLRLELELRTKDLDKAVKVVNGDEPPSALNDLVNNIQQRTDKAKKANYGKQKSKEQEAVEKDKDEWLAIMGNLKKANDDLQNQVQDAKAEAEAAKATVAATNDNKPQQDFGPVAKAQKMVIEGLLNEMDNRRQDLNNLNDASRSGDAVNEAQKLRVAAIKRHQDQNAKLAQNVRSLAAAAKQSGGGADKDIQDALKLIESDNKKWQDQLNKLVDDTKNVDDLKKMNKAAMDELNGRIADVLKMKDLYDKANDKNNNTARNTAEQQFESLQQSIRDRHEGAEQNMAKAIDKTKQEDGEQLKEMEENDEDWRDAIFNTTSHVTDVDAQQSIHKMETEQLESQIDQLMSEKNECKMQQQRYEEEMYQLKKEENKYKEEIENWMQAQQESNNIAKKYQQEIQEMNVKLIDAQEMENKLKGMQLMIESLYEDTDRLREENEALQTDKQRYELQLQQEIVDDVVLNKEMEMEIEHDYGDDDEMIKKQMEKYELEKKNINDAMNEDQEKQYVPLHLFECKDVYNKIKWWIYNDIDYKNNLINTMEILSRRKLNGWKINNLTADDVNTMVQFELTRFMTMDTINIMFDYLDQWKTENADDITSKHAAEIGYMIYHYPLMNLLQTIMENDINGEAFMKHFEKNEEIIKQKTGWKQEDIYQLEAILFKHQTFMKQQFIDHVDTVMVNQEDKYNAPLPNSVRERIKSTILGFDVESIHFKIKHGKDINELSDAVINMIDELIEINEENKTNNNDNAYLDDDFVIRIYRLIADCFIFNPYDLDSRLYDQSIVRRSDWICFNCSNDNFTSLIGSRINVDLSKCCLCGIQQRDAIILKLRNHDTFVMVNDDTERMKNIEEISDDIDEMIQNAVREHQIDLFCLNKNDNKQCLSMVRLSKYLIKYKRWIHVISGGKNDDINKTIQVDIAQFVDNDTFHKVFVESAESVRKITENDVEQIRIMINDNVDNIGDIEQFMNILRKDFINIMKKNTKIKPAHCGKLYSVILKSLKTEAQTKQFGKFLSDIDMNTIEKDYHHILKSHINHGTSETIKNAFRFFGCVVHYEDTETETTNCGAFKRRELRANQMNARSNIGDEKEERHRDNMNNAEDKNIWTLQQYHAQSQLDVIHSYLVHSNWKLFVQRYAHRNNEEDETEYESSNEMELDVVALNSVQNKTKYVTNYGFGVGHEHPYLSPIFDAIRDEMIYNSLCSIDDAQFQNLLIKAINSHKIAIGNEYKDELFCKYYNAAFNIIRNEPIGIKHILSIIIYTDLTAFCTAYRATYRKINNELSEQQVTSRHRQLYYYSRSLFEGIEFFGEYMDSKMKVFHGLSKVMYFDRFTAYFNQPISTTTTIGVAQQFSNGTGLILTLKSGTKYNSIQDPRKIPKYLSVSWLSGFPNEDEKLFYGAYVRFKIHNITESQTMKGHSTELSIFNKFQKMIKNQNVDWNENNEKEKKKMQSLVLLIKHEQNLNDDDNYDIKEEKQELHNKYITKYGQNLFHYFCSKTTQITIKNFKSFPKDIYNALFVKGDNEKQITLNPITKLFRFLKEITLNDLNIGQLTLESKQYIDSVMQHINDISSNGTESNLEKIIFQSKQQYDGKINSTLKQLANKNVNKFNSFKWKIKYRLHDTHNLTFINYPYINVKEIKHCDKYQMIRLVIDTCNKSDNLIQIKRFFVSWFKENNIDGAKFINYKKEEFAEAIVTHFGNKETLNEPSKQLFDELNGYDFVANANEEKQRQQRDDQLTQKFDKLRKQLINERKLNDDEEKKQKIEIEVVYAMEKMKFESKIDTLQQKNVELEKQILIRKQNENALQKQLEQHMQIKQDQENGVKQRKDKIVTVKNKENEKEIEERIRYLDDERVKLEKERKALQNEKRINNEKQIDIEMEFKSKMNELQETNDNLKEEIINLKKKENKLMNEIEQISKSKCKLVTSTAQEIDNLRYQIKMHSQKNWNGLIQNDNNNGNNQK